jgi:hypothetical protein
MDSLSHALEAKGWRVIGPGCYEKGDWTVDLDGSSWMIVLTKRNPRVFDVHVPSDYESGWTANLIEHLCSIDDECYRLRATLEAIRDNPRGARQTADAALKQCYHRWLVNVAVPENKLGRVYCAVCGALRSREGPPPN